MYCPNCAFKNPDNFKYCGNCGKLLTKSETSGRINPLTQASASFLLQDAERRYMTVMFCDLVGSTAISEQLDPEEFREILRVYQDASSHVVQRYEGYVAQYLGDGILVYFGYPKAHEDDAQRAARCALEIIEEMENLSAFQRKARGINLQVRIGIHTGLVILSELGGEKKHELLALGKAPNLAARLQATAQPNSVVVSNATYRLIKSIYSCRSIGTHTLKGVARPIEVFEISREDEIQHRMDIAITTGLTPLVGRKAEVNKLIDCWNFVKKGEGRVALVIGEAGIGKTRLLRFFEQQIKEEPHLWLVCSCHSYYRNSAFYPIINLLQKRLRFEVKDSYQQKCDKLKQALEQYDFNMAEALPLFASLLSIPIANSKLPVNLSPQKQKQKTIELLISWMLQVSQRRPVLFVIENLHWADPSTIEHISQLMEHTSEARILVILTFHPRFKPPATKKARLTQIMLRRLARKQIESMVSKVTGGKNIPNQVLDLVQEKTDGVPLFVEELTRMLLESGIISDNEDPSELMSQFDSQDIPDTLQETLMARLDHLGAVKEVVQIAAVLGREFSFDLINAVAPFEEDLLLEELDSLVEADILDRQGEYPDINYTFRQALIQDAAYYSLLKSTRQHYHKMVARLIDERFPETLKRQPEILAHHYAEAGFSSKAIELLIQAGKVALLKSANIEAIQHLKKGLHLLAKIPESKEKKQLELDLNITLGVPLLAIKGFGAPEVGRVYQRARELSQQVGDIPSLFPALHGLYRYYLLNGSLETAFDLSELMLSWAQTSKNTDLLLEARRATGSTLFHMGDASTALDHLKRGVALYDFEKHRSHSLLYGTDPKTVCLCYGSLAQYVLGYSDQALQSGRESIDWAREIEHPFSLAMALNHYAWLNQSRGEYDLVEKAASELVQLSSFQGFAFWKAAGLIFMGWALARKDKRRGIKQMILGVEAFTRTGARLVSPYFFSLISETYLSIGNTREGKRFIKEAENVARENGEHFYDAEICRLRGESVGKYPQQAERHFKEAIKIARRQQAKSFELRTAIRLAKLWLQQHKEEEAQKILVDLVDKFSEGHELTDLKQAKQLIEEIS